MIDLKTLIIIGHGTRRLMNAMEFVIAYLHYLDSLLAVAMRISIGVKKASHAIHLRHLAMELAHHISIPFIIKSKMVA